MEATLCGGCGTGYAERSGSSPACAKKICLCCLIQGGKVPGPHHYCSLIVAVLRLFWSLQSAGTNVSAHVIQKTYDGHPALANATP